MCGWRETLNNRDCKYRQRAMNTDSDREDCGTVRSEGRVIMLALTVVPVVG